MSKHIVLSVLLTLPILGAARPPQGEAPREGMAEGRWSSGNKEIFGTSYEAYGGRGEHSEDSPTAPLSKVWFTGAQGILTEVFWPTLDRKQSRDTQFLVSDGRSFFSQERGQSEVQVEVLEDGVPVFRVKTRDPQGRYELEKTYWTDPRRPALLMKVRWVRHQAGLQLYLLHNPAVANTPLGDSATVALGNDEGLYAWQGVDAQALVANVALKQASAAFAGPWDGFQDLAADFRLDTHFERALDGNVVLTAWMDLPSQTGVSEFTVAMGFGDQAQAARAVAQAALNDRQLSLELYRREWQAYQSSVKNLSSGALDGGKLFRNSVAMLKSMEDKTYSGAFVASPSVPWGLLKTDNNAHYPPRHTDFWDLPPEESNRQHEVGGYHLVWPRDLYQMATTFLALRDPASAVASLRYLRRVQFGPDDGVWRSGERVTSRDGSWLQNGWLSGEPFWTQLQLDQTALPLLLAFRLWKEGHVSLDEVADMSLRAAAFIVRSSQFAPQPGPWTRQERWEENMGASPSTIASQIAALWAAAELAEALELPGQALIFRSTAEAWSEELEKWTFTRTGPHGNGQYYLRVTGSSGVKAPWDPDSTALLQVTNGGPRLMEKAVLDGGFLELVRLGVRRARDIYILESLQELDATLAVHTRMGPAYTRYVGDRYHWDESSGRQTRGMLWPFLSGERAHFEVARALEEGKSGAALRAVSAPYVRVLEAFASSGGLLPEQVWDEGPRQGLGAGSATPLGWAHGEYIKLLRSREDSLPFDLLEAVQRRAPSLE